MTRPKKELQRDDVSPAGTELFNRVHAAVTAARIIDVHTHLFAPQFDGLNLWGIDELLTYHYLIAEYFRFSDQSYAQFWRMTKQEQADAIWQKLFVENSPLSEATCGVVSVLSAYGLDPAAEDLREARSFFRNRNVSQHIEQVLTLSGVSEIVMTNDPFDPMEAAIWKSGVPLDPRFKAVVRLDTMLNQWENAVPILQSQGWNVSRCADEQTYDSMRRFLAEWIQRMSPVYMAVSVPDTFDYPESSARGELLNRVVLPACAEFDLPLALMIGVRRQVNPDLRLGGDGVGRADITAVERICAQNPQTRFLVTVLSRENQHELCVAARKFRNLMPFGCWWFVNNASLITEITRMRFEMLGTSFIPQHSDARVLDQLIYKWNHSRRLIAQAMTCSYEQIERSGRMISDHEIARDVELLFAGNFKRWIHSSSSGAILETAAAGK
jgi:hypothetical protein